MKIYWIKGFFLTSLVVLLLSSLVFPQATAVIQVLSFSPYEVAGTSKPVATGLKVVGVGETVYLKAREASGQAITSFAWALGTKPAGSQATLTTTDLDTTRLVPDVAGTFEVTVTITTAKGTASASIQITGAKWVGVGGQSGLPVDIAKGQCYYCHLANAKEWEKTGHATIFSRGIDGVASDHYASYCIRCHTVGYNTAASAVNDGFDDIAAQLGWVFPTPPKAGEWNNLVNNFPALAHLGNVQCENCHGPGSLHLGKKGTIDMSLEAGVCGYCHEDGHYHIKNTQWKNSAHARELVESSAACLPCHSGWGFVREFDPIAVDNRPTSGSYVISCAVCHDPHSAKLAAQVRETGKVILSNNVEIAAEGTSKICMQCHKGRRDAVTYASTATSISPYFGPHRSPQTDMFFGQNAITYDLPVGRAGHQQACQEACLTCHMAPTPAAGQPGHNLVGEHSFAMAADGVENVAVCQSCHGNIKSFEDIPASWDYDEDGTVESAVAEIEGLLEVLGNLLPPDGPTVAITAANYDWRQISDPAEIERRKLLLKAAFNYRFVEEDGSRGIHNTAYAATLLRRSIASLTIGSIGAGRIESIVDVPNDQGKQVIVTWSKFPADGSPTNPIVNYQLWLRLDGMGNMKTATPSATIYSSIETMPANAPAGSVVTMNNENWLWIKSIPASGMAKYSVIAPTLYDSTKTDGIRWSVFKVTGHTSNNFWYVTTAPDSGYSVDNLAPMAPVNLQAQTVPQGVLVKWDPAMEADFKYYALYKAEQPLADVSAAQPIAKLTQNQYIDSNVQIGKTYYYYLTSYDFAGNNSPFSVVSLLVTHVQDGMMEIPADYVLEQNHPNPFNPSTTIGFALPKQQHVTISVYDLRGALVRTLTSGTYSAGKHQVVWDGRSDDGNIAAAGTYIYRLETEGITLNKKLIFLK